MSHLSCSDPNMKKYFNLKREILTYQSSSYNIRGLECQITLRLSREVTDLALSWIVFDIDIGTISECLDIVECQAGIVQFPTGIGISKTDDVDIECTLHIKNMKESVSWNITTTFHTGRKYQTQLTPVWLQWPLHKPICQVAIFCNSAAKTTN